MIPFSEALGTVLGQVRSMGSEAVPLAESCGRMLATAAVADRDLPPCDVSLMDGFACKRADLPGPLTVTGTVPAGKMPELPVGTGECVRIMTGAVIPDGADTVVMVEHAEENGGRISVTVPSDAANIRYTGENVTAGVLLLKPGTVIGPAEVAILASTGTDPVNVSCRPRVGVIATGDEVVEPADVPGNAHIRNSNSYQLCAQVQRAGGVPQYFGIIPDDPDAIGMAIKAAAVCDVVLLSGGVSMGDFDFVPGKLKEHGVHILFEKVAVKPGKPTVFGVDGTTFYFGMPGNPVSTYMIFELLVRPLLAGMMGGMHAPLKVPVIVKDGIVRRDTDRTEFRPVRVEDGKAVPVAYTGSAHFQALSGADGMVMIPQGVSELKAGAATDVMFIP